MPGYMNDIDGSAELEPNGRVVILEDIDADGRMVTRTVFLDGLALPRAVAVVPDGALVAAPPICCWRLTKTATVRPTPPVLDDTFAGLKANTPATDCGTAWTTGSIVRSTRGNTVSSTAPWNAASRPRAMGCDPHRLGPMALHAELLSTDGRPRPQAVAMNRINVMPVCTFDCADTRCIRSHQRRESGYADGTLTADFTLSNFAPVQTGHLSRHRPRSGVRRHAFICEPAGNRSASQSAAGPDGHRPPDPIRTSASSPHDERFRPVQARTGDGACTLDMYRGVLQHHIFMTTFLASDHRAPDWPSRSITVGSGELVPDDDRRLTLPDVSTRSGAALIDMLECGNGPRRLLAQQLLIQPATPVTSCHCGQWLAGARRSGRPMRCGHCGMQALDDDALLAAAVVEPQLRLQAMRVAAERIDRPQTRADPADAA